MWKNLKSIPYTKKRPEVTKIFFNCINGNNEQDGRFKKSVYISIKNELDVIVTYAGESFYLN